MRRSGRFAKCGDRPPAPLTSGAMRRSVLIAALAACALAIAGCGGSATRLIVRTTTTSGQSAAAPAAGLGLPRAGDQEHHPGVRHRPDRQRGRGRARGVPLGGARHPPDRGDARSHRRLAGRDRLIRADGAADPGAGAAVRQRGAPGGDHERAQPARADRHERARRRAGDPGRGRPSCRRDSRGVAIPGADPYTLAAAIDRFATAAAGKPSPDVVIASGDNPAYAMPAAGWAAESGNPILFVNSSGVPAATQQALQAQQKPHIYVLGPSTVIPDSVLTQLRKYGTVSRIGDQDPAANSVAFAIYRDPPCVVRPAVRARPGQLRLGDAQPRSRLHAAQRQPTARRRGIGRAVGERQLRPAAAPEHLERAPEVRS